MSLNLLKIAEKRAGYFFRLDLRIRETDSDFLKFILSGRLF